jgi:hypothetical protein
MLCSGGRLHCHPSEIAAELEWLSLKLRLRE